LTRALACAGLATAAVLASVTPTANAKSPSPTMTPLAEIESGLGSGSTIGPDRALYVTDGNEGAVLRVDRRTGETTPYATGLPKQALGIGGAMDVAFVGRTAYVLVTMVGGDIVGGDHIGDDTVGIYRLNRDGSFTVVADIGTWSVEHPPTRADYFITTGVQYAMQPIHGGFLVTDGHHNRILRVGLDGDVREIVTLDNIVPTGLETFGNEVYFSRLGPVPHAPDDGRIVAFALHRAAPHDIASGASMLVDVEFGPHGTLYALSQGTWNGEGEGSPALNNTGRLVKVGRRGTLTPVTDRAGHELVLDQPTSLEFVGTTAYVISLTGAIVRIDNL